jgi:hypothetical protein
MIDPASWFRKDRQISRTTAWICLLINQLLTPGLGTLVAGRLWSGLIELAIAFVGFGFVMAWFFIFFKLIATAEDLEAGLRPRAWLVVVGLGLFGLAWLLSLISGINIVRRSGGDETRRPPRLRG